MTALSRYERLEAEALWRADAQAQRRAVFVFFGDASLTICDRVETPLAHWSLAAVQRLNPGERPALYAPDADATETLEIEDAVMIEAIETVRRAITSAGRGRGWLRRLVLAGVAVAGLGLVALWLPGALLSYTASVVLPAQRAEIGRALLAEMAARAGPVCTERQGRAALAKLRRRVLGETGRIAVLPGPMGAPSQHLPGDVIVLSSRAIAGANGPERAAALVLAERLRAAATDPLERFLGAAGAGAAITLLTTGAAPGGAIADHAARLLAAPPDPPPADAMRAALEAAGLPAAPYAYGLDPTGETVLPLIEADPFAAGAAPPLLSDGEWVALEGICGF